MPELVGNRGVAHQQIAAVIVTRNLNAVLAAFVSVGILETCKVSKNGTAFDGYRLIGCGLPRRAT